MSRTSNGHGSVFRSADGRRWEGYLGVGIDPATGKRIRKHVRGRTKSEVQRKVDRLITQGERGAVYLDSRTTLSQWLDTWVEERLTVVRPSTLSGYRTDLLYVSRSGTGAVPLDRLQRGHLNQLYDWVIAGGRNRGTLQHLKRTLNPALDTAVARGYLDHNPLPQVPMRGEHSRVGTPYDFDEISKLLVAARSRRNGARWDLALLGLRQGEVLGLQWHDVDLDRAELTVRRSLRWRPWQHGCEPPQPSTSTQQTGCGKPARWCPQRHSGGPEFAQVKTQAGDRAVALPAPLVNRLREHREQQLVEQVAAGASWSSYNSVFATPSGSPIDRTTDREEWLDLVVAAGVRQLRVHDLRHTAATALLLLGEDSRTIMAVMGWSSQSLVARYAHVVPDLRRRVATKQVAIFNPHPPIPGPGSDQRYPELVAAVSPGALGGGRGGQTGRGTPRRKKR